MPVENISPAPVCALWVEGALSPVEQLALTSFVMNGHPVALYVYGDVTNIPAGVEVRDGRDILPEADVHRLRYRNGSYALASNLFRYELQRRSAGVWIDTDVVSLKPFPIDQDVIAGRESDDFVNGAVLYFAAHLPIAEEAVSLFRPHFIPPWVPLRKRARAWTRRLKGEDFGPEHLPHGTFGPKGVTALLKKHELIGLASPPHVFYPLAPRQARAAFGAELSIDQVVRNDSLTLHLWNEKIGDLKRKPPQRGSIVDTLMKRYGIG